MKARKTVISFTFMLAFAACVPSFAQTSSALPMWERKSAPAVILGRVLDFKQGEKYKFPGFWGNGASLKGEHYPAITTDSIHGTFTFVWDICYPLKHSFHGWDLWLCPGDTIRLDIDRGAMADYEAYKKDTPADSITTERLQELWQRAVHTEGGTVEQPLPVHFNGLVRGYRKEYAEAHLHDTFAEWQELCWREYQEARQRLDLLTLSPAQRAYQRLGLEEDYVCKRNEFMFCKTSWGLLTDEEKPAFEQQVTLRDPHAAELTFYRDMTGFYALSDFFGEKDMLDYLRANNLQDSPLGHWLQELEVAHAVMTRAKAMQPVEESEIEALAPEYQVQIREMQATLRQQATDSKGIRRELPEGEPHEWLPKIVAEHKGRIVFVDFWATWCGPCRQGMKEMETVKKDLLARGVDFIYITDTSSNADTWLDIVGQHAGDHYITPKGFNALQIPGYDNAIPHYLIYDRDGRLVKFISGWPGVEEMVKELEKAMSL